MKTRAGFFMLALLIAVGIAGCNKDNFTEFYSTGNWHIDRYYLNNADMTDDYLQSHQDYLLELRTSNDFTETYVSGTGDAYGVTGTWEVQNHATILRLYDQVNGTREYTIATTSPTTLTLVKGQEKWVLKK